MVKIGINGLGRIGRAILRINEQKKIFDIVVINDIKVHNIDISFSTLTVELNSILTISNGIIDGSRSENKTITSIIIHVPNKTVNMIFNTLFIFFCFNPTKLIRFSYSFRMFFN